MHHACNKRAKKDNNKNTKSKCNPVDGDSTSRNMAPAARKEDKLEHANNKDTNDKNNSATMDEFSFASSAASMLEDPNGKLQQQQAAKEQEPANSNNSSVFRSSQRVQRQVLQQKQQQHLALPLSMRLMKHVAGVCCLDCGNPNQQQEEQETFERELLMKMNYDANALSSFYCQPTATAVEGGNDPNGSATGRTASTTLRRKTSASPLVLAPMTMSVVHEEEDEDDSLLVIQPQGIDNLGSSIDEDDTTSNDYNNNNNIMSNGDDVSSPSFLQQQQQQQQQQPVVQVTRRSSSSPAPSSPTLSASSPLMTQGSPSQPQQSAASKLVATNSNRGNISTIPRPILASPYIVEKIVSEYIAACRFYGVGKRLNAGVLTTLRYSLPCMRITGRFHDDDMLALAEILLRYVNGPLRYIKRLDFSLSGKYAPNRFGNQNTTKGMHSHGGFTLAKVLQMSKYIEEVYLDRNRIGPYGASAIFIACSTNTSLKKLNMRRCRVFERGARVFAEWVATSKTTALQEIDLSANYIGVKGSLAVERALMERMSTPTATGEPLHHIAVDLEGNHVLQEVMNSVTHGLGVILAVMGSCLMTSRAREHDELRYRFSCGVYSASLIVLYMSSTLYHSFFSMQNTKYIFEVFDKSAIYILIAGSYTPFLQIVLGHKPIWSVGLLIFQWVCCFLGISVEATCPTWEHKMKFSLAMYLSMGWSALVCLPEISSLVPENCINVMVLGGVGYTSGVPFFVRNNNLDHAVWHLFVLAGSIFHWCGVYFYVVDFVLPSGDALLGEANNNVAEALTTCMDNQTAALDSCVAA